MSGPILIADHMGVHPSALDKAVEEQRAYYAPAWALARKKDRKESSK